MRPKLQKRSVLKFAGRTIPAVQRSGIVSHEYNEHRRLKRTDYYPAAESPQLPLGLSANRGMSRFGKEPPAPAEGAPLLLDSRLRGNDTIDIFSCRNNILLCLLA